MKSLPLLIIAALAAVPLAAQQGQVASPNAHKGPGPAAGMQMCGMHMEGMGMHAAMAFAPAYLLERKNQLDLTPQQVTRLEALRDATKGAHDRAAAAARSTGDSLRAVLAAAAPDTALARRLFQMHHDAMGEAHWSMLRAGAQAKALLTDAQRARVDGWADAMHNGHH